MNIYQISSYIYGNTGSAIDTEVVDGICPDDTIEVSKRVTYPQLASVVAVLGEKVGSARRITPHSLRRSFATEARRRKIPDREIMASGGWSTREMLDRYDMNRLAVENTASVAVAESLKKQNKEETS